MLALDYFLIEPIHELFLVFDPTQLLLFAFYIFLFWVLSMSILAENLLKVTVCLNPIIQYSFNIFFFEINNGIRYQLHLDHKYTNAIDHDYDEDKSYATLQEVNQELINYDGIDLIDERFMKSMLSSVQHIIIGRSD